MHSRATRKRRTGSFDRPKKISRSEEEVRVVCTLCKKKISPSPFVSSETRSISTFPIRPSKFSRSPFLSDSLEIYHLDNKDFSRSRRKLSRRGLTTDHRNIKMGWLRSITSRITSAETSPLEEIPRITGRREKVYHKRLFRLSRSRSCNSHERALPHREVVITREITFDWKNHAPVYSPTWCVRVCVCIHHFGKLMLVVNLSFQRKE